MNNEMWDIVVGKVRQFDPEASVSKEDLEDSHTGEIKSGFAEVLSFVRDGEKMRLVREHRPMDEGFSVKVKLYKQDFDSWVEIDLSQLAK